MFKGFLKLFKFELSAEILVPLILIALYVALLVVVRGAMPSTEELIAHISSLYERYGYEIIFLGALLEALVLVNFIVPGAFAVGLGAVFARTGQLDLTYAVMAASSGAMLGYLIDFFLGYFGFGEMINKLGYSEPLKKIRNQIESSGVRSFSLGFVHPNIGSLISLASGTLRMKLTSFIMLAALSTLAWVSAWALIIFSLGDVFLLVLTKYFFIVILFVLSVWLLAVLYGRSRSK